MNSPAGIRSILMTEKGHLLLSPVYSNMAGLKDKAELNITDFNPLKTARNQNLSIMKNFKIDFKTFQASFRNFWVSDLQLKLGGGVDSQIVTTPQTAGQPSSGGVFNFTGNEFLGMMFDFLISNKERSIKYVLEMATERYIATTLENQSLVNAVIDMTSWGYGTNGVNYDVFIPPAFLSLQSDSSNIFTKDELVDYSCKISTKEREKTSYNRSIVDYYSLLIELTGTNASMTKIVETLNRNPLANLIFNQYLNADFVDSINIEAGVLARREEVMIADDKRNMKVIWEADVPIDKVTVSTDAHTITIQPE